MLFFAFPLLTLIFFSLSFIFVWLIHVKMFLLGLSCMEGTLHFLDLSKRFLSHVREVFGYNLFKYFLRPSFSLRLEFLSISDPRTENHCFSTYAHAIIVLPLTLLSETAPKPSHHLTQFCYVVIFEEHPTSTNKSSSFCLLKLLCLYPNFFFPNSPNEL